MMVREGGTRHPEGALIPKEKMRISRGGGANRSGVGGGGQTRQGK